MRPSRSRKFRPEDLERPTRYDLGDESLLVGRSVPDAQNIYSWLPASVEGMRSRPFQNLT